jgi:hypothetical protein
VRPGNKARIQGVAVEADSGKGIEDSRRIHITYMKQDETTRDEVRRGTLFFLNLKLVKNQSPQGYVDFFDRLFREDPAIPLNRDKRISMNKLHKEEIIGEGECPRLLWGEIMTYDLLDKDAFYDKKKNQPVRLELGADIVAHRKTIEFYFSPSAHRLTFFDNQPVTPDQVQKFFEEAAKTTLGEGELDVTFEVDRGTIEKILNAPSISTFEAMISYSNKDPSEGFDKLMDEKIHKDNVTKTKIIATPTKKEGMQATPGGFLEAITKLAQSNGYVVAKIQTAVKGKKEIIDTRKHPMKKKNFQSKQSRLRDNIHKLLQAKFRSNQ